MSSFIIESRVFEETPSHLCIDMGEWFSGSWLTVSLARRVIVLDHSNMDGDVLLTPAHARKLASKLLVLADAAESAALGVKEPA